MNKPARNNMATLKRQGSFKTPRILRERLHVLSTTTPKQPHEGCGDSVPDPYCRMGSSGSLSPPENDMTKETKKHVAHSSTLARLKALARSPKSLQAPNLDEEEDNDDNNDNNCLDKGGSLHVDDLDVDDDDSNRELHLSPGVSKLFGFFGKLSPHYHHHSPHKGELSHGTLPTVSVSEDHSQSDSETFFNEDSDETVVREVVANDEVSVATGHRSVRSEAAASVMTYSSFDYRSVASASVISPKRNVEQDKKKEEENDRRSSTPGPVHGTMWVQSPEKGAKIHLELNVSPTDRGSILFAAPTPLSKRTRGGVHRDQLHHSYHHEFYHRPSLRGYLEQSPTIRNVRDTTPPSTPGSVAASASSAAARSLASSKLARSPIRHSVVNRRQFRRSRRRLTDAL